MEVPEEIVDPYCLEDNPVEVTFNDVILAAYRIKSGIRYTDCVKSDQLSDLTGVEIYLKKEFLQASGSFKERGARNAIVNLPEEIRHKGIVAASSGNHALACCYHGNLLGVPVTVYMPVYAPIIKIQKCKHYKGNVMLQGNSILEAKKYAQKYAKDNGMMYINGYDHIDILAGQGTIGLEIWEQVSGLEAVLIPIGGGGLLAGMAVAMKTLNKNILVYGVEPTRADSFIEAIKKKKPVAINLQSTLADGLAVGKVGVNAFASAKKYTDKLVSVDEPMIALAIVKLLEFEKIVVEGAGAIPLAAILEGSLTELKGKKVCLILSGGNIDSTVLGRVIERGLAADGRLVKITLNILDRPGGIEELCDIIGDLGVSIKDIKHERAWLTFDIFSVQVKIVCETIDNDHSIRLRDAIVSKYGPIEFNGYQFPPNK